MKVLCRDHSNRRGLQINQVHPQRNPAPKALLSCAVHSLSSDGDIQKSSATYPFSYMPGNSAHISMFYKSMLEEVEAHPIIKFRFPPLLGRANEIVLQWKPLCAYVQKANT